MDSFSLEKMVDKFFDMTASDGKFLELIEESKKYDVFNLISRVSALNLLHQNQSKSLLLDTYIDVLLHQSLDCFNSKYKISQEKFRRIINGISNTSLKHSIDPPENMFAQNVMFYGNYRVLNGIDQTPAYNLQQMISSLFVGVNSYPKEFLDKVYILVYAMLYISEDIVCSIKDIENNHEEDERKDIIIPSSKVLNHYSELVVLDGDTFRKFLHYNKYLLDLITIEFGVEFESDSDNKSFYTCPFLYNKELDQYILLNAGLLPTALVYWILTIAKKYGIYEVVMENYNQHIFNECKHYLSNLGHHKIVESQMDIELFSCDGYKEYIASVHNNQLMIVMYVYDYGKDYTAFTLHSKGETVDNEIIDGRLSYLLSKIENFGIKKEDVFFTVITNSIGRSISFGFNKNVYYYTPLSVNPFELMCISINEKNTTMFIPRYLMAKSKLNTIDTGLVSELNSIELYRENHSFYMSDVISAGEVTTIFTLGDSIDYIIRAIKKEDKRCVEGTNNNTFAEVVLEDDIRQIYIEPNCVYRHEICYYLMFDCFNLWIKAKDIKDGKQLNLYYMLLDMLSYWLSECRFVLNQIKCFKRTYEIQVVLTDESDQYQLFDKDIRSLKETLEICDAFPVLELWVSPESFQYLKCNDNSREKEFMQIVIKHLNKMISGNNKLDLNIEPLFINPMRKKFHFLNYENNPCFKPALNQDNHFVHGEDEDMLLGEIGEELIRSGKWDIGVVHDSKQKSDLMHAVVDILFKKLQDEVRVLDSKNLLEIFYDDLEKLLYKNVLYHQRYAQDIACYPEREEYILEKINTNNKTSVALKFLVEYVAAIPPKGNILIGEGQYERLLAICFLIIDWSYKNDLFYYKIFDTPVEILKSHRVGLKHGEFEHMYTVNQTVRKNQLLSASTYKDAIQWVERKNYLNDIDVVFEKEYGYTLKHLVEFVEGLNEYSKTLNGDTVFVAKINEIIEYLTTNYLELNKDRIILILESISLKQRETYLPAPKPYKDEDVYPWRFNRELSFVRRPILIRDDEMIWGNRQLSHMILFVLDLIDNGKLKTKSNEMKSLIGEISNVRGAEFNELVFRKLKSFNAFDVYSNVSKVNRNKIAENKNPLGDIDVLIIDKQHYKIIAGEVKEFNVSRNPYEMYLEYKKMFENTKKKRCFYDKHSRRVDWCSNHVEDFKIQYNLEDVEWEVVGLFILDQPLISTEIYHKDIKMLTEKELSVENIRSVY